MNAPHYAVIYCCHTEFVGMGSLCLRQSHRPRVSTREFTRVYPHRHHCSETQNQWRVTHNVMVPMCLLVIVQSRLRRFDRLVL
jgi:hypothetical protein